MKRWYVFPDRFAYDFPPDWRSDDYKVVELSEDWDDEIAEELAIWIAG